MKLMVASLVMLFVIQCKANSGPFGLGVILGSPTGFSTNYLLSKKNSIAGASGADTIFNL